MENFSPDPDPISPIPRRVMPRRAKPASVNFWRILQTVLSTAFLVATLFTIWTPASLVPRTLEERMNLALQQSEPTAMPNVPTVDALSTPSQANPTIGIVVGHLGFDSGAICADGLTEVDVNLKVATQVQKMLGMYNYQVHLLEEFDPRLEGYYATILLSIHADSCVYINDQATGFKVAAAMSVANSEETQKLTACLSDRYAAATGLRFHYNTITDDMSYYHAFAEIHPSTLAVIIETGFLNLDRYILTEQSDLVAKGIVDGLMCYLNGEVVDSTPTSQP